MTPERAAEIAGGLRFQYAMSNAAHDAIKDAILRACKEQKEADAKICEGIGPDDWTGENCAKAIRSAE